MDLPGCTSGPTPFWVFSTKFTCKAEIPALSLLAWMAYPVEASTPLSVPIGIP